MRRYLSMHGYGAKALFLIGLFSMTQIRLGAKIGISEAVCCLIAPFLFMREIPLYKRDGVMIYFNLLILWMAGALFADFYNHSVFQQFIRGVSVPIMIFSVSVCVYHYLRRDTSGLKWLLLGVALSYVISTFVFQRGSAGDLAAEEGLAAGAEKVMGYKLFWSNMAKTWLCLPIQGWYQQVPMIFAIPVLIAVSVINLLAGGRSAFLVSTVSIFLVFIGGKRERAIQRIKRAFPVFAVGLLIVAGGIKWGYGYLAKNGYLNEYETEKYEKQTSRGSDVLSLLIAGRGDFFVGLFAALDKPIVGHGSQAIDYYGYERDYLSKYGSDAEIERYINMENRGRIRTIRSHSHVICYWMWHGVLGLLFWLYILYLVIITVKNRLAYIPEWFGYFAVVLPNFMWDFFFSPFGQRVEESVMFCTLLVLMKISKDRKTLRFRQMGVM